MARSEMINFRLREEDVPKLDNAAKKAGMSRSDFIRRAVTELVARYSGERQVSIESAKTRGPAIPKTKGFPFPDCPRNAACKLQKLPTGVKVCGSCGVRTT